MAKLLPNSTVGGKEIATKDDVPSKATQILIDDSSNLFTSTNVEGALSELFTNVSNGKNQVATAITDKGVSANGSDTFNQLASKIGQISTGKKMASGVTGDYDILDSTITFPINVDFMPTTVIVQSLGNGYYRPSSWADYFSEIRHFTMIKTDAFETRDVYYRNIFEGIIATVGDYHIADYNSDFVTLYFKNPTGVGQTTHFGWIALG